MQKLFGVLAIAYWAPFEHSGLNLDQRLGFCLRSQRRASVFLSHTRSGAEKFTQSEHVHFPGQLHAHPCVPCQTDRGAIVDSCQCIANTRHHRGAVMGAVCAPAGLVFRCEKDTWRWTDAIRSWRGDGVLGVVLGVLLGADAMDVAPTWDALDAPDRGAPRGVILGISRGVRARGTRDVARGVPRGVALGVGIGGGHVLTSGAGFVTGFGRGDRTTYMYVGVPWSTCGLSSDSSGSIARCCRRRSC